VEVSPVDFVGREVDDNDSSTFRLTKKSTMSKASGAILRPAPPFSSLTSIPSNMAIFGSVLAVQRVSCKMLELFRRRQDMWNEAFGFAVTYRYYTYFLVSSDARLIMHNRVVGGTVAAAVVYANLLA